MTRSSQLTIVCILSIAPWLSCSSGGSAGPPAANTPPLENLTVDPDEDDGAVPRPLARRNGLLAVACEFDDGWFAVIPQQLAAELDGDEFVMQALIGLTEEPDFWTNMPEYKKLKPFAAARCGSDLATRELDPGEYVLFIGWAGQYGNNGYTNNGRIEPFSMDRGQEIERRFTPGDLNADLPCISCPFLLVWRDGEFVELGQILVDRYAPGKQGSDDRRALAGVIDGRIAVKLAEREPEVSYIDAVEVWHDGQRLAPVDGPGSARERDGALHTMAMGEEFTMYFQAPPGADELPVEIRVDGYYILERAPFARSELRPR